MARSAKQYENEIKVIVVAALSREFKRSAIIDKVVAKAKSLNQVATKGLVNPSATASIIPYRNDRWLTEKNSVLVKVTNMKYGVPNLVRITLNLKYGLAEEYYWLTKESPRAVWKPNGSQILNWIKAKGDRGNFTYNGKPLNTLKEYQVKSVAFLISRSIGRKGIKKTDLFNPFKDKKSGVEATVNKSLPNIYGRISDLYGASIEESVIEMLEIFR